MYVFFQCKRKGSDYRFLQFPALVISKVWDHFQKEQRLSSIL